MTHDISPLDALSAALSALVSSVAPRVVSVDAGGRRPTTGIAIGADLVLAADHAVERESDIGVTVNGTRHDAAAVAGRDPATDIAVLRVPALDLPPVSPGPIPATGALVVSIARTGSGTVSAGLGVITSVGGPLRTARGPVLPAIIRTDAALRPGTSGGALVDASGRIVGMTTAGLMRGLPVAIPASEAIGIAGRLAAQQPLGRGYLGVNVHGVALSGRQQQAADAARGLLVLGVVGEGAADQAGLVVGDVLVRFAGRALRAPDDLQDALAGVAPGATATVTLLRGVAVEERAVTVAERPA